MRVPPLIREFHLIELFLCAFICGNEFHTLQKYNIASVLSPGVSLEINICINMERTKSGADENVTKL